MAKESRDVRTERAREHFLSIADEVARELRSSPPVNVAPTRTQFGEWEEDPQDLGWYATVAQCRSDPQVKLELWFDRYLSLEKEKDYILGVWVYSRQRSRLEGVTARVAQLWQPVRYIENADRVPPEWLLNGKKVRELTRDQRAPILDCWNRNYFLGSYLPGIADKTPAESVGEIVLGIERLASFFSTQEPEPVQQRSAEQDELRRRQLLNVLMRPEQAAFRRKLRDHFGDRCALSGCRVVEALEAAHITPVAEHGSDTVANGLLLRADLHALFDARQLRFEVRKDSVRAHLEGPARSFDGYRGFHLKPVQVPEQRDALVRLERRATRDDTIP